MVIKKIYLENFRNYEKQEINLNENINVFYGNNAQGKTNILEALYYSALGRSFRTYKDSELIRFGKDSSKIDILYEKNNRENEIEIVLNKSEKKIVKINGIKINKSSELIGNLNIVIFSPDDILILKQSPSLRRKFLDILISQLKPNYVHVLSEYNKVLEQRNALLKSKNVDTIEIWNEQLADLNEKIFNYRKYYIEKIQEKLLMIHPRVTNERENIKIVYKTKFEDREKFLNLLEKNLTFDLYKGYTSIGAHRDDFEIYINDNMLNVYGSQGQHRTAILSLKIAELEILKEQIGENPVLLLDDVTSELDLERIRLIFSKIQDYQVFITCTDVGVVMNHECLTNNLKLYKITNGSLEEWLYIKFSYGGVFLYVHIGNDEMLKINDIVAIFDVDTLKESRNNLRILNMLKNQSSDIKSVILVEKKGISQEYFSVISSNTLKRRIEQIGATRTF